MASESQPPRNVEEVLLEAQTLLATIKDYSQSAKTGALATAESKQTVDSVVVEMQAKLAEITSASTQAIAAKTKIVDDQTVIATKSDHIQKAQEHADTVRANLDRALTAAMQQVTKVEAEQSKAQTTVESATALFTDIQTKKATIETDATAITELKQSAVEATNAIGTLADKAAEVEAKIKGYEKRLLELELECDTQLKTIENLLPGATAAGLASSWDERRKTFLKPHNRWQWLFVGALVAIVVLTISGLIQVYMAHEIPKYDELFRLWLVRLPIAGALIWLALHASHEAALAKRLEEDYGYKATVASCLMGFQKQIAQVGKDAESNPSLSKLLDDTLMTIASPPGRIYDNHKLVVSPSDELKEAAKAVLDVTEKVKKSGV